MIAVKTVLMMMRIIWNIHSPLSDGLVAEDVAQLFTGTVKMGGFSSSSYNSATSKFSISEETSVVVVSLFSIYSLHKGSGNLGCQPLPFWKIKLR